MIFDEIRAALAVLAEPGAVIEIRAFGRNGSTWSGYYSDAALCADAVEARDAAGDMDGIYVTLNPVDPALHAKRHNRIERLPQRASTTADAAIVRRRWLLVDIDVNHPAGVSGISSTDLEKAAAVALADRIAVALTGEGWPGPVVADSGNGAHLLYRVDLPNDEAATDLIKRCLKALSQRFDEAGAKVDTTVYNAARISKLYGTVVRKGSNTPERPHRRAALARVPDELEPVPVELLQALADEASAPVAATAIEPRTSSAGATPGIGINLRAWLEEHAEKLAEKGIAVREKSASGHFYFGTFERCPFSDGTHVDGARIGQWADGTIYATCKHTSCQGATEKGRGWQTIRALVDPKPDPAPRKTRTKSDGDKPSKRVLPHFEKDGRLYLDARDERGHHWFAHLDGADELAFSREVIGADGIAILPRELPIHQDTGMAAAIVGLPSKEAMEAATVMDAGLLFAAIDGHLHKYIDMPKEDRTLFIYYIFYSWFYRKARTAPYLRFIADTGKGKSRIVRAVADLCFFPVRAAGASSFSGIFRNKERWHGTLVIDESDLQGGADNQLVKYLNLGFEADQPFLLSDKNDPSKVNPFDPFGPKVIGMRQPFGDNATEGRVLSFEPRETRRRDIPVEVDAEYDATVVIIRAHLARFALAHWADVTADSMMDVSNIDVEPRLKQMLRPVSLVLSVFPDGGSRLTDYVQARQIEVRRERAASFDGLVFNLAVKLADGAEDLRDDPKFQKYYRKDGTLQAVEARMIAAALGVKRTAISTALRGMGFSTKETSIRHETVDPARENEQGKIRERKLTISKVIVSDVQAWREMVGRYFFPDQGEGTSAGQAHFGTFEPAELTCPAVLRGPRFVDAPCDSAPGTSGTAGTDLPADPENTGSTGSTGIAVTRPPHQAYDNPKVIEMDANSVQSVSLKADGDEVPA